MYARRVILNYKLQFEIFAVAEYFNFKSEVKNTVSA